MSDSRELEQYRWGGILTCLIHLGGKDQGLHAQSTPKETRISILVWALKCTTVAQMVVTQTYDFLTSWWSSYLRVLQPRDRIKMPPVCGSCSGTIIKIRDLQKMFGQLIHWLGLSVAPSSQSSGTVNLLQIQSVSEEPCNYWARQKFCCGRIRID